MSRTGGRRLALLYLLPCAGLAVGAVVLVALHAASGHGGLYESWQFTFAIGIWSSALGCLLLWRRPQERLGWVVAALGATGLFQTFVDCYAAYSVHVHRLPGAAWVFLTDELPSSVLITLLTLLLLLFPTGRLPSRRWRWLAVALVVVTAAGIPGRLLRPGRYDNLHQLVNPIGVQWAGFTRVADVANTIGAPLLLAAVVSVAVRWRQADPTARDQIKGLVAAVSLWPVAIVVLFTTPTSFSDGRWGEFVFVAPIAAMLLAVAVAVLRYRLYDIDRLISRTVSYALVTGLLVGLYAASVAVCTRALPLSSSVGVAASTLAVAAAFQPLRRRVQASVDHRFNRTRYDAARTVGAYSASLRDSVHVESVVTELLTAVGSAVQPSTVSVWLRSNAAAREAAS